MFGIKWNNVPCRNGQLSYLCWTTFAISHAELSFIAASLNLCLCLKSSPITVEFWQAVQQNDEENLKDFLSSQIDI